MKKHVAIPIIFLSIIVSHNLYAQKSTSFNIVAGGSYAELWHLGVQSQFSERSKIGFYYGNGLYYKKDEYYRTFSLDYQYHFGRLSKHIDRHVYYTNLEPIYWTINNVYEHMNSLALCWGIGRNYYFSDKFGLSLNFALIKAIHQDRTIKDIHYEPFLDITLSDCFLLPTFRFQFFYSF